jgi:hypothetical protein
MSRPRVFYPGKGAPVSSFKDEDGEVHVLKNHGLPYVNSAKNGKPFTAGGMPIVDGKRITPEELMAEVDFYTVGMKAEMERREAAQTADPEPQTPESFDPEIIQQASEMGVSPPVLAAVMAAAQERGKDVIFTPGDEPGWVDAADASDPVEPRFFKISPTGRVVEVNEEGQPV